MKFLDVPIDAAWLPSKGEGFMYAGDRYICVEPYKRSDLDTDGLGVYGLSEWGVVHYLTTNPEDVTPCSFTVEVE